MTIRTLPEIDGARSFVCVPTRKICKPKLLLGRRINAQARGWWFTPGGRIRKNEALVQALQRVAREELGLAPDFCGQLLGKARLMGAWDHFYPRQRLQRQRVNPLREPAALAATVLGRGGSSQAAHG